MTDYSQFFDAPPAASAIAVGSADASPEEAGNVINLSQRTGAPATLIQADPQGFQVDLKRRNAAVAVQQPEINNYVASNPLHAQVSNDDYDKLGAFSKSWKAFTSGVSGSFTDLSKLPNALARDKAGKLLPVEKEPFQEGFEWSDFLSPLAKLAPKALYGAGEAVPTIAGSFVGRAIGGAVGSVFGPVGTGVGQFGGMAIGAGAVASAQALGPYYQQGLTEGLSPDAAFDQAMKRSALDGGINAVGMGAFGWSPFRGVVKNILAQAVAVQPGVAATGKVMQNLMAGTSPTEGVGSAALGGGVSTLLNPLLIFSLRGHTVPEGIDKTTDTLRVQQNKIDTENLDNLIEAANDTKTKERSPAALEAFAEQHDEHTISIPVDAVKKVYDAEGTTPSYGDHLFGFQPDIAEQISVAMDTGQDVRIPLSRFVANIDEGLYEKIKDDIRHRPEGLTANEAADAEKALEGEDKVSAEAPKEGFVRFYHGADSGTDPTTGGSRWVTPDANYARLFRASEADPKEVHYVDIPRGDPAEIAARAWDELDEQLETNMIGRYRSTEIPEEWAKQLKPLKIERQSIETPQRENPVEQATLDTADAQKKGMYLNPLFADAKAAGMTEAEFKRYSSRLESLQNKLLDKAVAVASRDIKRRQSAEWKANESQMRQEVETDLTYNPTLMADRYLRTGNSPNNFLPAGMKLDRDFLVAKYGEDVLNELPKAAVRKGATNPDVVAQAFGFASGEGLVNRLRTLENARRAQRLSPADHFKSLVDDETSKRMEERYGDLDENIYNEARDAVLDDTQLDVLHDEWKALAAQSDGDVPFTKDKLQEMAGDIFSRSNIKDARDTDYFQRVAGKMGREAERALLAGKPVEAFQAKQRQLINFMFAKEAAKFEKLIGKAERQFKAAANPTMATVDQPYLDQVHRILDQIGWGNKRNPAELARALEGKSLEAFIDEKNSEGWPVQVIDYLKDPSFQKNYNDLTIEQIRDISESVDSMLYTGRLEKTVQVGDQREAYEDAVGWAIANLDDLKKEGFDPRDRRPISKIRSAARNVDAMMIKMEQLFDWMDKRDPRGVLNQVVFRPLSKAEHWKLDTLKDIAKDIKSLPKLERQMDMLENEELLDPETHEPMKLDREAMMAIAMNMGSESNAKKLLNGWGWNRDAVTRFLDKNMSEGDIAFANGLWKVLDKLRPKVEEVTRKLTGVGVDLIEPSPTKLANGTLVGGYYPLIEDRFYGINRKPAQKDLMDDPSFQPLPTASAVKNRTGANYPLALILDSVPNRITETVHYLAFREPMLNARKLLSDPLIRKGVSDAFGPEYTQQFEPWLRNIATNGGVRNTDGWSWVNKLSREARMNVQTMFIGLNPVTAFIHGGSAALNSIQEVGASHIGEFVKAFGESRKDAMMRTVDQFFKNDQTRQSMTDEVMAKSGELRNRKLKLDDNIEKAFERSLGADKGTLGWRWLRNQFHTNGHFMVANLDMWSAIPTWKAMYDEGLRNGYSEADAVYAADKAVRNAHGASGITDTPAVQRGPEFAKWATMFMGYFAHNYNRLRDTARIALSDEDRDLGLIASRSALYLALPAAWHYLFRGNADKKDTWGDMAADALLSQTAGGLPIVRDTVYGLLNRRDPTMPIDDLMKGIETPFRDALDAAEGHHKVSDRWLEHALNLPGWTMGIGTKQTSRAAQFLWDYEKGKENPHSFFDWYKGVVYGHVKRKGQ